MNKIQENRARRAAKRQGLRLVKSRLRDSRAVGYGCYLLLDFDRFSVFGVGARGEPSATLAEIEGFLTRSDG